MSQVIVVKHSDKSDPIVGTGLWSDRLALGTKLEIEDEPLINDDGWWVVKAEKNPILLECEAIRNYLLTNSHNHDYIQVSNKCCRLITPADIIRERLAKQKLSQLQNG